MLPHCASEQECFLLPSGCSHAIAAQLDSRFALQSQELDVPVHASVLELQAVHVYSPQTLTLAQSACLQCPFCLQMLFP